jgi:RodZ C-terminal domain
MPETRGERIIFGIVTVAIAALVALIVVEMKTDLFKTHRTPAVLPPVTTAAATTEAAAPAPPPSPTTVSEPTSGKTTAESESAHASNGVRLTLTATADTWVDVRAGSVDGDVFYVGILPQGSVKRFRSKRVWVRFGAAANLTARLNGRPLYLPPGTYDALVGARGLQVLGG